MGKDFTETLIEKHDTRVLVKFKVRKESDYFDGHFPQLKILPAVGQIDILVRICAKYFNTPLCFFGAKRLKFSAIIQPDDLIHLEVNYNAEKRSIAFSMTQDDGKKVFSSGSLSFDN
ncbi:hypothetical protein AGMMS50212_11990 [Spirochaetia bacterium]|nr:hypothetical protein AGMMS50212_11990 [Spirochaetia bacterium]